MDYIDQILNEIKDVVDSMIVYGFSRKIESFSYFDMDNDMIKVNFQFKGGDIPMDLDSMLWVKALDNELIDYFTDEYDEKFITDCLDHFTYQNSRLVIQLNPLLMLSRKRELKLNKLRI